VLDEEWASRILGLPGEEAYAVSAFAPTHLYKDRPTYIYGAAIADPKRHGAVNGAIGGVAIVFDAAPQFAAMLVDALPRDGAGIVKRGAFGLLVDPEGRIISCSDEQLRPGDTLAIAPAFLQLDPGKSHYGFTAVGKNYYAVGACASSGYREYKGRNDAYRNNVIALIFTPLCDSGAPAAAVETTSVTIRSDRMQSGIKEEIATFFIGKRLFAARAAEIVEATDAKGIVALPLMPPGMTGCLMYRGAPLPVFDMLRVLEDAATAETRSATQVVVMEASNGHRFGLMVDALGEIVEVAEDRVRFLPSMVAAEDTFADAALTPDSVSDGALVVVLRADQLYTNLAASAPTGLALKMAAA
jgi:chemotaxis signal transduction protein